MKWSLAPTKYLALPMVCVAIAVACGEPIPPIGGSGGSAGSAGAAGLGGLQPRGVGPASGRKQMENIDRGLVAVQTAGGVFLSWRLLGYEPRTLGFNVYRNGSRLNATPLTQGTNHVDAGGSASAAYSVRAIVSGVEQAESPLTRVWPQQYWTIPLQTLPGHVPNDASVGDLDGDGQYELVLKQEQTPRDNSQSGATGQTKLEAYELDGTLLWRIDLGPNIREGAHYTQFIVYDLNGDGRAEVACRTADGTRDGRGTVIGDADANHRNADGYVLSGPEYLTVFDGRSGQALVTTSYVPARGSVSEWGDNYGNRVDRFLAGVAYLDGARPSLIFARGYYTRSVIVAWDYRNGQLSQRWTFDSNNGYSSYAGQGNHQLSVADVDSDGRDEIIYGAMTIDDDGRGLYTTGLGHGDALHVSDMDPNRPGLEYFDIQERVDNAGAHFNAARSGAVLWRKATAAGQGEGPGRGVAADISASRRGYEMWVAGGGLSGTLWDIGGNAMGAAPASCNFLVWWDGDLLRELLDSNVIDKYGSGRLLTAEGCSANNGTKSTPALSADILGDWREEVIWRTSDNRALRIYTTTIPSSQRIPALMHDAQYRTAIAWQNVGYNQPPHPSFFLGDGMATPPAFDIHVK